MEGLSRLTASRGGYRSHLTKLQNKLDEIMESEIDAVQRATLIMYMEQLQRKGEKLSQLDAEIAALLDKPEDLEREIFESEDIQNSIMERICVIKATFEVTLQISVTTPTLPEQDIHPSIIDDNPESTEVITGSENSPPTSQISQSGASVNTNVIANSTSSGSPENANVVTHSTS